MFVYRQEQRRPFRSITVWTDQWLRTVISQCEPINTVTPSTLSKAKCGRNHPSPCGISFNNANDGSRESCWWSIRNPYRCAIKFYWPFHVTPGSHSRCRLPTLFWPHCVLFRVQQSSISYAHSSEPSTYTCIYLVLSNLSPSIDSECSGSHCAFVAPCPPFRLTLSSKMSPLFGVFSVKSTNSML